MAKQVFFLEDSHYGLSDYRKGDAVWLSDSDAEGLIGAGRAALCPGASPGGSSTLTPLGYEQIVDLTSPIGLTVPTGATMALMIPEYADIRWRDDGVDPTMYEGMPLAEGATLTYDGNLSAFKAFDPLSSGAVLNVSYYK